MTKDDLKAILKESLSVKLSRGDFISPNDLTVEVYFDNELITSDNVWMKVYEEYEG